MSDLDELLDEMKCLECGGSMFREGIGKFLGQEYLREVGTGRVICAECLRKRLDLSMRDLRERKLKEQTDFTGDW